jgi:hypothetical protein
MLDWREEGEVPALTDNTQDTPGCLSKGPKKNFRSSFIEIMSTLPLLFWKTCIGKMNKFVDQEMDNVKEKGSPDNVLCGVNWRHNTTLGAFMVFMGILLYMSIPPPTWTFICKLTRRVSAWICDFWNDSTCDRIYRT